MTLDEPIKMIKFYKAPETKCSILEEKAMKYFYDHLQNKEYTLAEITEKYNNISRVEFNIKWIERSGVKGARSVGIQCTTAYHILHFIWDKNKFIPWYLRKHVYPNLRKQNLLFHEIT